MALTAAATTVAGGSHLDKSTPKGGHNIRCTLLRLERVLLAGEAAIDRWLADGSSVRVGEERPRRRKRRATEPVRPAEGAEIPATQGYRTRVTSKRAKRAEAPPVTVAAPGGIHVARSPFDDPTPATRAASAASAARPQDLPPSSRPEEAETEGMGESHPPEAPPEFEDPGEKAEEAASRGDSPVGGSEPSEGADQASDSASGEHE